LRVLSRRRPSYPSRRSSLNPRPVNLLQPLWRSQKSQLLWNQANPASFCKTPGVGVPLRELVPCTEAQKCVSVTPLLATLAHSVSRKSFAYHSYENTRDGSASARPRHDPGNADLPIGVHFRRHMICATWRLYPLWPHSIAYTFCHHGGVPLHHARRQAFRPSGMPTLLLSNACRLFVVSLHSFPHSFPLFSTACSLFSQNTRRMGYASLSPARHSPQGQVRTADER
jgi:hypothetical protein